MNILLRVDAGGNTGLGHYFRSISLAKTLIKQGCNIFLAHLPSTFWSEVELPFETFTLDIGDEESKTLSIIKEKKCSVFYVDGIIEFDKNFITEVQHSGAQVVFYQNLSQSKYLCDIFILPSLNYDQHFFSSFSKNTLIFKGLKYTIFNERIYSLPKVQRINKKITTIGLTSGGSDPKNVLLTLYNMIDHHKFGDINFFYFYGQDFMYKSYIPELPVGNVQFVPFDLPSIGTMDLVISTFGVSTYELMYLGVPILSVGHQISNALASERTSNRTGAIIDLGLIDNLTPLLLNQAIETLADDYDKRLSLNRNATKTIDATGLERVSEIIISLKED